MYSMGLNKFFGQAVMTSGNYVFVNVLDCIDRIHTDNVQQMMLDYPYPDMGYNIVAQHDVKGIDNNDIDKLNALWDNYGIITVHTSNGVTIPKHDGMILDSLSALSANIDKLTGLNDGCIIVDYINTGILADMASSKQLYVIDNGNGILYANIFGGLFMIIIRDIDNDDFDKLLTCDNMQAFDDILDNYCFVKIASL